jgi:hypothetical protein
MRERCVKSCGVFLHGRYSGGDRRTGLLNPQYPTCFIKVWRHKSVTLICYQFRTAAATCNYLRDVYSSTGQCWLVLNGKYVRIFRNVVDEHQRLPILSWGQSIWSCNFHRSDFEWSYWTSEVDKRGLCLRFPFRCWHESHSLTKTSTDLRIPGHQKFSASNSQVRFTPGCAA